MTDADSLKFVLPQGWARAKGFSYGVMAADRDVLCVAGQLAVENGAAAPPPGLGMADQFVKSLENVVAVVRAAGGQPSDIAALRVFVTDIGAYKADQPAIAVGWRRVIGAHFPAMTMVEVGALYEETAMVEIEAIALLRKEVVP
jgi:enamine deaminase RidA (YjgF/YER057c/UK114 family)